jgi:hypothetical protein
VVLISCQVVQHGPTPAGKLWAFEKLHCTKTFSQVLKIEYVGTGVGEGWGVTVYKVRPLNPTFDT